MAAALAAFSTATPPATACGGGGVTTRSSGTVANAQRILISVRGDRTEVVAQIGVPQTNGDYGVLIPVPEEPTLDPQPVAEWELDQLDAATAPSILTDEGDDDSGFNCGCLGSGSAPASDAKGNGVSVSAPTNVGPVTAVVLAADSGSALGEWLSANGFAVNAADQPIVDEYVGAGNRFIAIKRNSAVATGGPTSIGLHYSLPGDHRKLSFRFARLGAAPSVTFTVFVAATQAFGPSPPFLGLTLNDLHSTLLREGAYEAAVRDAIRRQSGHAFVLERSVQRTEIDYQLGPAMRSLIEPDSTITRATAIIDSTKLDADPVFDVPRAEIEGSRVLSSPLIPAGALGVTSLGVLAVLGSLRKRRRPSLARPLH